MSKNRMLWQGSHVLPMFRCPMGKLHRQLCKGEFAMFKNILMFESDFIQINRRGEVIGMHNSAVIVTVGIAYTSPSLTIPDVMLLARQVTVSCAVCARSDQRTRGRGLKTMRRLELTRLLPLKLVKLSIHSHEKKQLHLKLASGSSFYLQLCPPSKAKKDLFAHWEDLVFFLRPPVEAYSCTEAMPAYNMKGIPVFEAEDRKSPAAMEFHGGGAQDQVSIRSLHTVTEISEDSSLAYAGGEGVQQHASSSRPVPSDTLSFPTRAPAEPPEEEAAPTAAAPEGSVDMVAGGEVTGKPVAETLEGAGAGPLVSAYQSKDNVKEETGGQRVSQHQAEALRKGRESENTSTKGSSHSDRTWEDKSNLKSHRTTQGAQKEGEHDPGDKGHGSSPQKQSTLGTTQKKPKSTQKARNS